MRKLNQTYNWEGKSSDPNDEQFGHVVEPATLETADSYGAVLVGEPYDGAVIGRPGAREGPSAIRDQLAGTKTHHIDAGPVRSVGDLGDIPIPAGESVSGVQESVRETTKKIHGLDTLPVFMGGDNSLTYPNVAPLLDTYDAVGTISFDAHFDCREVLEHPSSGTPYRQLHEDGLDAFAVVGARHFENSTEYADYVLEQGGEIVTAEEVSEDVVSAIDYALEAMEGADAVYVSVDMDVLDASAGPGVSAPTPGGISTLELYRGVRMVAADDRVVGFEVVECSPPLDFRDMTSKAAARGVAQFLGGAKASGKI